MIDYYYFDSLICIATKLRNLKKTLIKSPLMNSELLIISNKL
jgi:hypothetical protein